MRVWLCDIENAWFTHLHRMFGALELGNNVLKQHIPNWWKQTVNFNFNFARKLVGKTKSKTGCKNHHLYIQKHASLWKGWETIKFLCITYFDAFIEIKRISVGSFTDIIHCLQNEANQKQGCLHTT
jgi:hypothetical protein